MWHFATPWSSSWTDTAAKISQIDSAQIHFNNLHAGNQKQLANGSSLEAADWLSTQAAGYGSCKENTAKGRVSGEQNSKTSVQGMGPSYVRWVQMSVVCAWQVHKMRSIWEAVIIGPKTFQRESKTVTGSLKLLRVCFGWQQNQHSWDDN